MLAGAGMGYGLIWGSWLQVSQSSRFEDETSFEQFFLRLSGSPLDDIPESKSGDVEFDLRCQQFFHDSNSFCCRSVGG